MWYTNPLIRPTRVIFFKKICFIIFIAYILETIVFCQYLSLLIVIPSLLKNNKILAITLFTDIKHFLYFAAIFSDLPICLPPALQELADLHPSATMCLLLFYLFRCKNRYVNRKL